jgi:hypothetical protein
VVQGAAHRLHLLGARRSFAWRTWECRPQTLQRARTPCLSWSDCGFGPWQGFVQAGVYESVDRVGLLCAPNARRFHPHTCTPPEHAHLFQFSCVARVCSCSCGGLQCREYLLIKISELKQAKTNLQKTQVWSARCRVVLVITDALVHAPRIQ